MGSAASTSAKPAKDVVLDKPMVRHERAAVLREIFDSLDDGGRPRRRITTTTTTNPTHRLSPEKTAGAGPLETIAVRPPTARGLPCRGLPLSLRTRCAGDFQISRAEYVRLMGTRGVAAAEASATFDEMDHSGSNVMTVAKMQHYVQIRAGNE